MFWFVALLFFNFFFFYGHGHYQICFMRSVKCFLAPALKGLLFPSPGGRPWSTAEGCLGTAPHTPPVHKAALCLGPTPGVLTFPWNSDPVILWFSLFYSRCSYSTLVMRASNRKPGGAAVSPDRGRGVYLQPSQSGQHKQPALSVHKNRKRAHTKLDVSFTRFTITISIAVQL